MPTAMADVLLADSLRTHGYVELDAIKESGFPLDAHFGFVIRDMNYHV
tara:strand:+ start:2226 stop:2369 length:144 start_codon:yes stop_codon:yes gene_type:complete